MSENRCPGGRGGSHGTAVANRRLQRLSLALLVCFLGMASTGAQERVPLQTALPKPAFSGTPAFLVSANLEKATGRLRGPFLVPAGTANLATARPVTGSQPKPVLGTYAYVTDGNKEASGNSFVELSPGVQWVQIDLEAPCRVDAILVWHYHGEARVYRDVVIQLADDADLVSGLLTVFNNDHDNSAGLGVGTDKEYIETYEGRLIPVPGRTARFVRLSSQGNTRDDMNDVVEVEVYGRPLP